MQGNKTKEDTNAEYTNLDTLKLYCDRSSPTDHFNKLKICFWNLNGKLLALSNEPDILEYDVVCLTETWHEDDNIPTPSTLADYSSFSSKALRDSSRGHASGGILIYVKKELATSCSIFDVTRFWIILKISLPGAVLALGTFYLSPALDDEFCIDLLRDPLQDISNCMPAETLWVLGGDWNARMGSLGDHDWNLVGGSNLQSCRLSTDEVVNRRGRLLDELCDEFGLIVCNGRSPSDTPANYTYIGGGGASVIDLVMISFNGIDSFVDLAVEDFSHTSDHLPCSLTLRMESTPGDDGMIGGSSQPQPFRFYRVKEKDLMEKFKAELGNNEPTQIADHPTSDSLYRAFVGSVEEAGRSSGLMGFGAVGSGGPSSYHQPWYTGECRSAKYLARKTYRKFRRMGYPDDMRAEYLRHKKEYNQLKNKLSQEHAKRNRDALCDCRNPGEFWAAVRRLKRRRRNENPIPLEEWKLFFLSVYGEGNPEIMGEISNLPAASDDAMLEPGCSLDDPISEDELNRAISRTKVNKAPGEDSIPNELLRALPRCWRLELLRVFNKILSTGQVPESWGRIKLHLLYKKGAKEDPSNYRGLALLNTSVKLFTSILADRLSAWVEERSLLPDEQAGFRAGRSCLDQVFCLHTIAAMMRMRKSQSLVTIMIDFRRAFDSVDHGLLWRKLTDLGVGPGVVRVLMSLYRSANFVVKPHCDGEGFLQPVTEGVLQGDSLSPKLFILFLADLERFMRERGCHGVPFGDGELMLLIFADDISILADSLPDAQKKVAILQEYCIANRLTINCKKSNILIFDRGGRRSRGRRVICGGEEIKPVSSFQYLGVLFSRTGKFNKNKDRQISRAKAAIGSVRELLYRGKISSWDSRLRLFDALVGSVLLYASEIWGIWFMEELEVVQTQFLKSVLCLSRGVPGHFLRLELGRLPIKVTVLDRALGFLSRILKMDEGRWPKRSLRELVRFHRHPKNTSEFNWVTQVDGILATVGVRLDWENLTHQSLQAIRLSAVESYRNHCLSLDIQRTMGSGYNSMFRRMVDFTGRQVYLDVAGNIHKERVLAQLRLATTNPEMGKIRFWHKRSRYELDNNDLFTVCSMKTPETLTHFLLDCPLYLPYRSHYLYNLIQVATSGEAATKETILAELLDTGNDRAKMVALYQFTIRSLMLRAFARDEM
uniref:Putative RNA-directed DNA polymerase from transposon X-element n=1 Tax=Lygus hesperus TaxID=30085 RepID=A0A146LJ44_LYGHE